MQPILLLIDLICPQALAVIAHGGITGAWECTMSGCIVRFFRDENALTAMAGFIVTAIAMAIIAAVLGSDLSSAITS